MEPLGRGVTLHLQPERVRGLSRVIDAESIRQGMLEGIDGRKEVGDDSLVINGHRVGLMEGKIRM